MFHVQVWRHTYLVPSAVIPAIECDVRAGKINLPEFIAKCPAHCKETKQQVYGTGVFASISSICNAAIHRLDSGIRSLQQAELSNNSPEWPRSGVITNAGGKVIVKKMAGQNIYKGSNSNGVRSLSLPKWRESFVVSGTGGGVKCVSRSLPGSWAAAMCLCYSGEAQERSDLPIHPGLHPLQTNLRENKWEELGRLQCESCHFNGGFDFSPSSTHH